MYQDGQQLLIGDLVQFRGLRFWKGWRDARVSYVPGISLRHEQMEHGGLTWVGLSSADGTFRAILVDPESSRVTKRVRFVARADGTPFVTPRNLKPEDW